MKKWIADVSCADYMLRVRVLLPHLDLFELDSTLGFKLFQKKEEESHFIAADMYVRDFFNYTAKCSLFNLLLIFHFLSIIIVTLDLV